MKTVVSRKQKLFNRAWAYAIGKGKDGFEIGMDHELAAQSWENGYRVCMSDLRKRIASVPLNGEQEMIVVREFLKPMR